MSQSSQVSVIGGAYTTDPNQYQWLVRTAAHVGAPTPIIFGIGQPHPSDAGTIPELLATLAGCGTKYAICTDTYDTMFRRWNEEELVHRIDKAGGLILSVEAECWPPGEWCAAYEGLPPINGGQACGTVTQLVGLYREMARLADISNCQERLHRMYAAGYPMRLDANRDIFCSMSGGMAQYAGTYKAMLLHFNGRTAGIEDWARTVLG